MADEGILEEEATIDSRLEYQRPRRAHQAQDAINVEPDERSALLDFSDADASSERSGSSDPPVWHGDRDFDGLPWWKRPSVRWTSCDYSTVLTLC